MSNSADFNNYRNQYNTLPGDWRHCLENLGITSREAYETARADPRSVVVPRGGAEVPILTLLGNLTDRNIPLYQRLAMETAAQPPGNTFYLSQGLLAGCGEDAVVAMAPTVRQLAAERGIIAYDAAWSDAEQAHAAIARLIQRIGGVACRQVAGMPQHYHYLMWLDQPEGEERSERPLDFPDLYRGAVDEGVVADGGPIEVTGKLSEADLEHVAAYYAAQHEALTNADATEAGFGAESLRRVLTEARYTKIMYRLNGQVANMTILADVRYCPWINQTYARSHYPEQYDRGRMLIAIGAISDPQAPPGLTRGTVAMGTRLIGYAGGDTALGIATDDVSNQYVPQLCYSIVTHTGLRPRLHAPDPAAARISQESGSVIAAAKHAVQPVNGVSFQAIVLQPAE